MNKALLLDKRVATAFYGHFSRLHAHQEEAIEPLLRGSDLVLCAATGSGKTEAVMAPLVSRFWREAIGSDQTVILYVAPTKALVNDLEKRLGPPLDQLDLRLGVRHGDRDDLARGKLPHVLLTTPESLDVMLFRDDPALGSIRALVLDEAHLLYNTQRGIQTSILVRRLGQRTQSGLQLVALSATIGRLSDIQEFLFGAGGSAALVHHPGSRPIDAQVRLVPDLGALRGLLRRLLAGGSTKLLLFANSRRECDHLASFLREDPGLREATYTHYSSLSTDLRIETEQQFAANTSGICIATSTLELGIDIGDIDAVFLWGLPSTVESFLQRIGRGNRRVCKANVVGLVSGGSKSKILDALRFCALIQAGRHGEIPIKAPYSLYGAVGQQALSIIASRGGSYTRIADLCQSICVRSHLNRPVVEKILAQLASENYIQRHGFRNRYGADENLHRLIDYRLIYGNFPANTQTVDLYRDGKLLGSVPAINLLRVRPRMTVRFAGRYWEVRRVARDKILLHPTTATRGPVDFIYQTSPPKPDAFLIDRTWQQMHRDDFPWDILHKSFQDPVKHVVDQVRRLCKPEEIPYFRTTEGICYLTFGGHLVNKAIALMSAKPGAKPGDCSLTVPSPLDWSCLPTEPDDYESVFHLLFEPSSEQSLYQTLLPSELQREEFLQDWLKDETIPRILRRLSGAKAVELDSSMSSLLG